MSERISILEEIRSGGYEASLITTYNAYLPFYEDVVLRHLMAGGIRHNVLMMDAGQAAQAVDQHPPHSAGRFYTLVPIKVRGAFHPKVIFLVGKKKGTLLVGSHNLTLSGFGYNREMTNLIRYQGDTDSDGAALLHSAWLNILSWAGSQSTNLPDQVLEMVAKVQDFAPWLQSHSGGLPEDCRVLAATPNSTGLWPQLVDFAGSGAADRIIVGGAFFDSNLAFVERVRNELEPKEFFAGIDPDTVQFPVGKALSGVSFRNCAGLGLPAKPEKKASYLHAKSIVIERTDGQTVMAVGSANPSYPAWLAPGITKNVEMMIARKGVTARQAVEDLGLFSIPSMPPVDEPEWQKMGENWMREEKSAEGSKAAQIVVALAVDEEIKFQVPASSLPPSLECELCSYGLAAPLNRHASLVGSEYAISMGGLNTQLSYIRFNLSGKQYTGLIHHVRQVEGLSRTSSQRKFNDALASLTTGAPNLEYFVECIKEIIKINDSLTTNKGHRKIPGNRAGDKTADTQKEGAELSISQEEVADHEKSHKLRLRGADDLGYLLDVLLYNLRDEVAASLEDVLEDRDAKGRSEEEQIDADDEEDEIKLPAEDDNDPPPEPPVGDSLSICHNKVGSLVATACEKLETLKQGRLELGQLVIIMAGILSALRLLRGLEGKVPWIGAGQTAVPHKERCKLFKKIAEVVYDGDHSIVGHGHDHAHLSDFDEFARLKGLIIWLAWDSETHFADEKPFNESLEERDIRRDINRLYVATAQLIAGDEDVIREARQSIGQLGPGNMDWLEKLLAVDKLFRDVCNDPERAGSWASAKAGDYGFNSLRPELGIREIVPRGNEKGGLAHNNADSPRFIFPTNIIRTIPFEWILRP